MKCDAFAEMRLAVVHLLGQVWETLESLRTRSPNPPSSGRGGDFRGSEIAFDTGQGGGGFLGSVAVVQRLPRALHFLQNLVRGGFPVEGFGVLIPPVEKLSNILLQGLDRCRGSVLQAFPGHIPEHPFHLIEPRAARGSVVDVKAWMLG